jgi:hypothetical protein
MYQLPFSEDLKDQIRLQEAGGYIAIKANSTMVFQFDSQEDYQTYKRRESNEKNAVVAANTY